MEETSKRKKPDAKKQEKKKWEPTQTKDTPLPQDTDTQHFKETGKKSRGKLKKRTSELEKSAVASIKQEFWKQFRASTVFTKFKSLDPKFELQSSSVAKLLQACGLSSKQLKTTMNSIGLVNYDDTCSVGEFLAWITPPTNNKDEVKVEVKVEPTKIKKDPLFHRFSTSFQSSPLLAKLESMKPTKKIGAKGVMKLIKASGVQQHDDLLKILSDLGLTDISSKISVSAFLEWIFRQ